MKRVPFYRRAGAVGEFSGMKERIVWALDKGPATGKELAERLKIDRLYLNRVASSYLRWNKVVVITATDWVMGEDGIRDRTYTLVKKPAVVKPKDAKTRLCTWRAIQQASKGEREKNIEKAKRRARLIAAGLYVDEMG